MNQPAETADKTSMATGSNPVSRTIVSQGFLVNTPVATGDPPPEHPSETEFCPQLSPNAPTGPTVKRHRSKQDYGTPWEFIRACERRFGLISWDLAATTENTKAPAWITPEMDSLAREWRMKGNLWLNPPFADIGPWAEKCALDSSAHGARILFLTPASVGSNWFRDFVHGKALVLGLNGRLTFAGTDAPYPKDCILSAFGLGKTGFDVWTWTKEA